MRQTGWVLGYHGCDEELGEAVLRGEEVLLPSTNDYDWLGEGIYFWEGDPQRALDWAEQVQRCPSISKTRVSKPYALGAIIDPGHCLDLMESASVDIVRTAFLAFETFCDERGWEIPTNTGKNRKLDCAVINFLHQIQKTYDAGTPFDSVRALFPEGKQLYPDAGFQEKTHIQLAVRKESSIVAYFRPRFKRL